MKISTDIFDYILIKNIYSIFFIYAKKTCIIYIYIYTLKHIKSYYILYCILNCIPSYSII